MTFTIAWSARHAQETVTANAPIASLRICPLYLDRQLSRARIIAHLPVNIYRQDQAETIGVPAGYAAIRSALTLAILMKRVRSIRVPFCQPACSQPGWMALLDDPASSPRSSNLLPVHPLLPSGNRYCLINSVNHYLWMIVLNVVIGIRHDDIDSARGHACHLIVEAFPQQRSLVAYVLGFVFRHGIRRMGQGDNGYVAKILPGRARLIGAGGKDVFPLGQFAGLPSDGDLILFQRGIDRRAEVRIVGVVYAFLVNRRSFHQAFFGLDGTLLTLAEHRSKTLLSTWFADGPAFCGLVFV